MRKECNCREYRRIGEVDMSYYNEIRKRDKEIYERAKARNNDLIADLTTMLSANGYSAEINTDSGWKEITKINGYSLDWHFRISCHTDRDSGGFISRNVDRLKVNIYSPLSNRSRTFMEPKTGYNVNKIFAALLDLLSDIETNKKKNLESKERQEEADELRAEIKGMLPDGTFVELEPYDDGFKLGLRLTENEVIAFIAVFRSITRSSEVSTFLEKLDKFEEESLEKMRKDKRKVK